MPAPDYENDLVFEPQFTFQDLAAWIREKHADNPCIEVSDDIKGGESIIIQDGEENFIEYDIAGIIAINGCIMAYQRKPAHMQAIIKALFD